LQACPEKKGRRKFLHIRGKYTTNKPGKKFIAKITVQATNFKLIQKKLKKNSKKSVFCPLLFGVGNRYCEKIL